ncbi:MAG: hypothetical protein BWK79_00545 [Beggiatoa sp. IS2]|nr:MAG: hypothetical protein BWK79_00545 [Beggiatoa sp. IS2]
MLKDLPTDINLLRLAQQHCHLKGYIALATMPRLQESLCAQEGEAYIEWSFAIDGQQRPFIQGWVQAQLYIQCQRCLQPFYRPVKTTVALMVLHPHQTEDDLPSGYEEITLPATPIPLAEWVEDELILALPIVAMHDQCPSHEYLLLNDDEMKGPDFADPADNPFKILLQTLKKN